MDCARRTHRWVKDGYEKPCALLLLLVLPVLLLAQEKHTPGAKALVFTHVTVIDATGAPAKPDMTVVITGDRITALGKTGKVKVPADAQVVDSTGQFLIPGLWDMHVHTLRPERIEPFFPLFIANGVTGVRDMGTAFSLEQIQAWREEIALGMRLGPRIVAAGPALDGPQRAHKSLTIAVGNEAEGRQMVDLLKQRGADFIKVYSLLPRTLYFAIADEARKQGIPLTGHVPAAVTAAEASAAGQKSIEHLERVLLSCSTREAELANRIGPIDTLITHIRPLRDSYSDRKAQALFAHFVKNGTWQVPTLVLWRVYQFPYGNRFFKDPRLKYIPPFLKAEWRFAPGAKEVPAEYFAKAKLLFQKNLELVSTMRRAGVEFMAGTDTASAYVFPGFSLHDELTLFVEAGFTPMQALQTATRNPAKFLGQLDSLGTVEQGKIADLVLLGANPLAEIRNTQKIAAVVVGGRLIPKSSLQAMLAEVEAAANKK